jgi:hypothetical protein
LDLAHFIQKLDHCGADVGATTLTITTFSLMALSTMGLFAVLSVNDTHNNSISAIMLSVIMLNVIFYLLLR